MTAIRCLLEESAYISQHEPGIIQGEKIILFSEWNNYASSVAVRLQKEGVKPGDRVSVFMANDWRLLIILLGIIRAGAVACPLSTRLPRQAVVERMNAIDSQHLVAFLAGDNADSLGGASVLSPDQLIDTAAGAAGATAQLDLENPAMILFTSGSHGEPRPVVLSYGNLYYNARGANLNMRLRSKDRWLLNLPMYHVSGIGIMFRCLLSGAAVIIPEMKEKLIDSIVSYKPSYVSVVPAQLQELASDEDAGMITGMNAFLVGGDSISGFLAKKCKELKWPIYRTYGMTEMGSQITTVSDADPLNKRLTTSGRALKYREVMISDQGEILVKGTCLFSGYWNKGEPKLPIDGNGWFATGDLGELDGDGYLIVTGRKDNQFVSGGENIQPEEIERHLIAIEGIDQVVIVPVPNAKYGKRPIAFVKAAAMTPTDWCAELSAILPGFMIPDAFYEWPDDSIGNGLKVSRRALESLAASYVK